MIYTHVAAGIVSAALAAWGVWNVQAWRYDAHMAEMQKAHAVSLQKAEEFARAREQALSAARQKAEEAYVQEKRRAYVAAGRARNQLDGLRDELYALNAQARPDSATACRVDAGTIERELLGQCATALVGVAAEADGLAAQVIGLQGYVRNVCRSDHSPVLILRGV